MKPRGTTEAWAIRKTLKKQLIFVLVGVVVTSVAVFLDRQSTNAELAQERHLLSNLLTPERLISTKSPQAASTVDPFLKSLSELSDPPSVAVPETSVGAFHYLTNYDSSAAKQWLAKNSYLVDAMARALDSGPWPEARLRMNIQPYTRFTPWRSAFLLAGTVHRAAVAGDWDQVRRILSIAAKLSSRMDYPTEPFRFSAQYIVLNELQQMLYVWGSSSICRQVVSQTLQQFAPLRSAHAEVSRWYRSDLGRLAEQGQPIVKSGLTGIQRLRLWANPDIMYLAITKHYRQTLQAGSKQETVEALRAMVKVCEGELEDVESPVAAFDSLLSEGTMRWFLDEAWARQLTTAALAIYEFEAMHGALPRSLGECGEFRDPYGTTDLRFFVEKGGFALYSVGPNGVDNGGNRRGPGPGPLGYQQETDDLKLGVPRVTDQ